MKHLLATSLVLQACSLLLLVFGDIGFDLRGRFGLTFEHGILLLGIYIVSLATGFILALRSKRWALAIAQLAFPLITIAISAWPAPHLQAEHYQHLVGKSRAAVERELGHPEVTGVLHDERGEFEFDSYRGLTVYYNADGIVERIVSEPDVPH